MSINRGVDGKGNIMSVTATKIGQSGFAKTTKLVMTIKYKQYGWLYERIFKN